LMHDGYAPKTIESHARRVECGPPRGRDVGTSSGEPSAGRRLARPSDGPAEMGSHDDASGRVTDDAAAARKHDGGTGVTVRVAARRIVPAAMARLSIDQPQAPPAYYPKTRSNRRRAALPRRIASSCRSTTISSSLKSVERKRKARELKHPAQHHVTKREEHEASSVARQPLYSTHPS
jgi:hypothetical protein